MDIIITDDHKVVREGLAKIFSLQKDFNVIGEAASIGELFDLLEKKVPDIITLDISLPDRSGLDSIKDIKALYSSVKIMVFSIYQDETFGHRSLLMGADGYLSKSADPKEIVSAINKIYGGGKHLKQEVLEDILLNNNSATEPLYKKLSDREFEVLRMIGQGEKLTTIADKLNLSVNTIASYKSRIQEKLNINSTAALIKYTLDNRLI